MGSGPTPAQKSAAKQKTEERQTRERAQNKTLTTYEACSIIEGFDGQEAHSEDEIIEAFQSLIDSKIVWQLQGFYGRTAAALIQAGKCHN